MSENNVMGFVAVGRTITRSASLYIALVVSSQLINKINSSAKIWLSRGPDTVWFCRSRTHDFLTEQFVLRHMIGLIQMAAGEQWRPRDVRLSANNDHGLNRMDIFDDAAIRTGQPCLAVGVPKSLLSDRVYCGPGGNKYFHRNMENGVNAHPGDFVGSLRAIVESALKDRYPTIDVISEITRLSKRTLQRELAREGLSYRAIVGQARYRMACELLAETDMSIREISKQLSYSKDVHFIRAFHRWAGNTPGEHRRYLALRSSNLK